MHKLAPPPHLILGSNYVKNLKEFLINILESFFDELIKLLDLNSLQALLQY